MNEMSVFSGTIIKDYFLILEIKTNRGPVAMVLKMPIYLMLNIQFW